MPIVGTGQVSLGDIANEMGVALSNITLGNLSTSGINTASPSYPDGAQPHQISEFYGYDHNASSGPTLYEYLKMKGPFGEEEVCLIGPEAPGQSFWLDTPAPDFGTVVFIDPFGGERATPGAYYDGERLGYWLINDGGQIYGFNRCR